MWIERRWAGLLGVTALTGLWAFAVACGDEESPWPQTVLSGNPGGGVGGGSQAESEGGTSDDTGDDTGDDSGAEFVSCSSAASFICTITAASAGSCAATATTVGVCPSTNLLGCCIGTNLTSCYYTGSTAMGSTPTGCMNASGQFVSTVPQ